MIRRAAVLALSVFLGLTPAAFAVDLDALSPSDRRIHCFAYVVIDLNLQQEAGLIDGAEARRQGNRMSSAIYQREGSENVGAYQRRLDRAIGKIIAEKPSEAEFTGQVQICRALFRL
jgi:hypothetical protein